MAVDKDMQNYTALYAMTLLGIGEIIGGQLIGNIRDKMNNKVAIIMELVLLVISLTVVVIFNSKNRFNIMAYFMCFLWGLQDSGLNCIIRCILGFEFDSKIIPFSVFNFA